MFPTSPKLYSTMFTLDSSPPPRPEDIRLTQFSHGAGCGCKIAPAVLAEITRHNVFPENDKLLVGHATNDDAAVYDLGQGRALISTVDFFAPIVDDAFTYGQIAAANSLSDVYAMGGKPLMAMAVLGWPTEKLPTVLAQRIMAGAKDICLQAGVIIAGGHTIDSPEPFFGLSVNGEAPIAHIKQNSTAQAGDVLFLTKPLGTGVLATALKRGLLPPDGMNEAIASMTQLNSIGEKMGALPFVHALTDVTGFGLLGHLIEMAEGAHLSASLTYASIPTLGQAKELSRQFIYADNTMRNWKAYGEKTEGTNSESMLLLSDPQTNGGLLAAVHPEEQHRFAALFPEAVAIGHMTNRQEKIVSVM